MKIDENIKKVADYLNVDPSLLELQESETSFFFKVKSKNICIEVIKDTGMILPVPVD